MPATPARIGFITAKFRRATAGPDAVVEARHGKAARDTSEPVETFFEHVEDAQVMAEERLSLLSAERRYIVAQVAGARTAFDTVSTPRLATAQVTNSEMELDRPMLIVGISADLSRDECKLDCWG